MARNFPDWLKAYMHYTRASESPDQFHLWTGISVIAGALRRRVWIEQNIYQWTPNMYIILVGPPGVATKSTSMKAGQKLLAGVKDVNFGPASTTWQKLTLSMQEAQEEMKLYDTQGKETKYKMSCLTFYVSELGTFFRLEDDSFTSVLIDMFDGQVSDVPWAYDTKSQGNVAIHNPWINMIGCTTPSWLQANFPEKMIGGGLTSRIIFVYGDKKRQLVAYPSRVVRAADHDEYRKKLIFDLQLIATLGGEYKVTEPAMDWGDEWYRNLWQRRPAHMASERYSGYIARKQTHMHKIAMILAASQSSEMLIHPQHLQVADKLLASVEPDMIKVFESVGIVDETRHVNEVMAYVAAYGFITTDNLWRLCRNIMNSRDFDEIVKLVVQNQLVAVEVRDGKRGLVSKIT